MTSSVIRNPPVLEDLENYEQWKEDVLMWKEITDLDEEKQALAVHLMLKGQAKEVANQVSTEDKKKKDGLQKLLDKLDEAFLKEPERRKFMAYQEFEECLRKEGVAICEFMREFDTKYFRMKAKGMVLPDEVLAFRLVKNCRLTEVQKDQVMASTKPLSFKEVRATLKRMFESTGSSESESNQGLVVKEEPLYATKMSVRPKEGFRSGEYGVVDKRAVQEGEARWTPTDNVGNYGNQSRFMRFNEGRYGRNRFGRYPRRFWRRGRYDTGCFECGSWDHWARNCDKRKENDANEGEL